MTAMADCPTPGKVPYENRGAARQAAKDAERRFTLRGQMRPYSCECGNWHLTCMAAADFRRLARRKRKARSLNSKETAAMTDDQIKANLAAVRERMVAALGDDEEAVGVLKSVFPDDWADAPLAVIWMLGNAARFADTDTNGICTPAFAQSWLDRLVDSEGNPRDEFGRSAIEHVMDENALSSTGSLTKVFDREDRLVLELSVLKTIPKRASSRDEVRAKFVEHLTGYADTLVDALYEPDEATAEWRNAPSDTASGGPVSAAAEPPAIGLNAYAIVVHTANAKWWEREDGTPIERNKGELLMLMVSEIAEAMEGERKGLMDDKLPHRPMVEVELADALIRIFDYAVAFGYDIDGAYHEKMAYNAAREDHTHEARALAGGKKW